MSFDSTSDPFFHIYRWLISCTQKKCKHALTSKQQNQHTWGKSARYRKLAKLKASGFNYSISIKPKQNVCRDSQHHISQFIYNSYLCKPGIKCIHSLHYNLAKKLSQSIQAAVWHESEERAIHKSLTDSIWKKVFILEHLVNGVQQYYLFVSAAPK